MTRDIELYGGPADGTKMTVADSQYDLRLPCGPTAHQLAKADPFKPLPIIVAVYKRPANPLDWRWRFDGEEVLQ